MSGEPLSLPFTLILYIFAALMTWGMWFRAILEESYFTAAAFAAAFSCFLFLCAITLKGT